MITFLRNTVRLARLLGKQGTDQILSQILHPSSSGLSFRPPGTNINYERAIGTGLESNVLLAPILYIARVFPEAKMVVKTEAKGGDSIDPMHPMAALLRAPNKSYSTNSLIFATLLSWFLDGNAYWAKVRGSKGAPGELWYLPHWMVEPVGTDTQFLTGYRYSNGRSITTIAPENIVHMRHGIDPNDVRKGFSPYKPVLREAYMDSEASNLVAALLRNRGIPGIIIAPEKEASVGDGDLKAAKDFVHDRFTGDRRGEPMAVTAAIKIHQFGFNPSELDLGPVHNLSEERSCAMIGLPAALVGFGAGMEQTKVGATMGELRKIGWTDCINPTQDAIAGDITRSLGPDFGLKPDVQRLAFDRSGVGALRDVINQKVDSLEKGVTAGTVLVSEAREARGLEVNDSHRVFLRGLSVFEVNEEGEEVIHERSDGSEAPVPPGFPPAAAESDEEEDEEDDDEPKGAKARTRLTRAQRNALRVMDQSRARFESLMRKDLLKFLDDFGSAIEKAYLALFDPKAAQDEFDFETLFSSFDLEEHEGGLRDLFGAHYIRVHNTTAGAVEAAIGATVNIPDAVERGILDLGRRRSSLVDLTETARKRAFDVLADAREAGMGPIETARKLRETIPAGRFRKVSTRAKLIARTETRFAQNESALRTYEGMDGATGVQMVDARLGSSDSECMDVDGRIVSFEEGRRLMASEHPNGTRDMVPYFGEAPGV